GEDFYQLRDFFPQLFQLVFDLLPLETRQALQLHFENGLCLDLGELVLRDQAIPRLTGCLGRANQLDNRVDVLEGLFQAFQNVGPGFGLPQFILCTAANDFDTVLNERTQQLNQREDFRLSVDDRQVDDAERRLHGRQLVEVIQDHETLLAAL